MTTELRETDHVRRVVCTACPRCDAPLADGESLAVHLRQDCSGANE